MDINCLTAILLKDKPSKYLQEYETEIFKMIPELSLCKNFNQNNPWHIYDVYEHILHVVDEVSNNIVLRFAALFHDIGKPFVYQEDENGIGHFYGHWDKSKEIWGRFATKYNLEEEIKNTVSNLILYHDLNIDKIDEEELKTILNILNREGIILLFQLKRSDLLAQNEEYHYLLEDYNRQEKSLLLKLEKQDN